MYTLFIRLSIAHSIDFPFLWVMLNGLDFGTPKSSHHSMRQCVWLPIVIKWFERVLRCCSLRVAQRQFHGAYGPSLSLRSIEYADDGRGPMSRKNLEKSFCHSWQTVIPRPAYISYPASFGSEQRRLMCTQIRYSAVLLLPCLKLIFWESERLFRSIVASLMRQPQDVSRFGRAVVCSVLPHSQRHFHMVAPHGSNPMDEITVNRPNVCPLRSMRFGILRRCRFLAGWSTLYLGRN